VGEQIVCSNCLSNADSGLPACPYCGQSFENTNPAGTLPVNTLLAGRYTIVCWRWTARAFCTLP
jgi:hypothetical protein